MSECLRNNTRRYALTHTPHTHASAICVQRYAGTDMYTSVCLYLRRQVYIDMHISICIYRYVPSPWRVLFRSLVQIGTVFRCLFAAALSRRLCIRQHTSAYVSIRQRTSAYVSIRQHTSAYVSIRQHPSASVSIRQHSLLTRRRSFASSVIFLLTLFYVDSRKRSFASSANIQENTNVVGHIYSSMRTDI